MNANLYSNKGKKTGEIALPSQFKEKYRPEIIKRAVLAVQSSSYQPQGRDPLAGKRKSVFLTKRRKVRKSTYGSGTSRTPKKTMWNLGMRFKFIGAFAPNTKGGRSAFPPKSEKVLGKKINKKERRMAIRSAIAATANKEIVEQRGHKFKEMLIVVKDLEDLKKTKEIVTLLEKVGVGDDLTRAKVKKVRPGKGKMRGRKYKKKKGPLMVVSKKTEFLKSSTNIAGVDSIVVKDLNAEILAPGTHAGRLTVWSEQAIKELEKGLFK